MRGYIISGALLAVTGAILWLGANDGLPVAKLGLSPAAVGYALAAVAWVATAARAPRRLWIHALVVWIPLILPATMFTLSKDIGQSFHIAPVLSAFVTCLAGATVIVLRMTWPRSE